MRQYSTGTRQQLSPQLFKQMGHYRREVFINQLGWELNVVNDMELDEFDGPDAVYVCSHDDDGQVSGVARLLPTTAPYLLKKVFRKLWGGTQLPNDSQIWELSRFAAVDFDACSSISNQASARHAVSLFQQVVRISAENGARTLITVSPVGMERLLRVNRFQATRAGRPLMIDGEVLVALCIQQ